jgi:hypothetical protein
MRAHFAGNGRRDIQAPRGGDLGRPATLEPVHVPPLRLAGPLRPGGLLRLAGPVLLVAAIPVGLWLSDLPALKQHASWPHTVAVVHGVVDRQHPVRTVTLDVNGHPETVAIPASLEYLGRRNGERLGLRYDPQQPNRVVFDAADPPWLHGLGWGSALAIGGGWVTWRGRRTRTDNTHASPQ